MHSIECPASSYILFHSRNVYFTKAGVVSLQCNNCVICLSASEASFSQWGALQIQLPFPFYYAIFIQTFSSVLSLGFVVRELTHFTGIQLTVA